MLLGDRFTEDLYCFVGIRHVMNHTDLSGLQDVNSGDLS